MANNSTSLDILLQFLEQAMKFLHQMYPHINILIIHTRNFLHSLKSNPLIVQLLALLQGIYAKLPESVTLALTVSAVFLTSLMLFRVGRTVIGFIVTLIQISILLLVGLFIWNLREPLTAWLEKALHQ